MSAVKNLPASVRQRLLNLSRQNSRSFTEVEPDGLVFDAETLHAERIKVDADYEGIRVRFSGLLDTVRINMQIDIGFGDVVHPAPEEMTLPAMQRNTEVPASLKPLFDALIGIKQIQWAAFRRKLQQPQVPESFQDLSTSILGFIEPIIGAVSTGIPFRKRWHAPGPWSPDQEEEN